MENNFKNINTRVVYSETTNMVDEINNRTANSIVLNPKSKTVVITDDVKNYKQITIGQAYGGGSGEIFNDYANNVASGANSHAEGNNTLAIGSDSHAEGNNTLAIYNQCHAEGILTVAGANGKTGAHAEGVRTKALGQASHSEGSDTYSVDNCAHAEGYCTYAKGLCSHTEGYNTYAYCSYSHAEGENTEAGVNEGSGGSAAHAEGNQTKAQGTGSHAEGYMTMAKGEHSHAEGNNTISAYNYAHAEGRSTTAGDADNRKGEAAHAEGAQTYALGNYSHAEGLNTYALGDYSHVEGSVNMNNLNGHDQNYYGALEHSAHAEGYMTRASGAHSHAEGGCTEANGNNDHAEGWECIVDGLASHAEGWGSYSWGGIRAAHVEGYFNEVTNNYEHALGTYNVSVSGNNQIFSIGIGTSNEDRKNLITAYRGGDGVTYIDGALNTKLTYGVNSYLKESLTVGLPHIYNSSEADPTAHYSYGSVFIQGLLQLTGSENKYELLEYLKEAYTYIWKGEGYHSLIYNNQTNISTGDYSNAEGYYTYASGAYSHAEGWGHESDTRGYGASGVGSHTEGIITKALSLAAHAEGYLTSAEFAYSHSEGRWTHARNLAAHAEGNSTEASGKYSHAEGWNSKAIGAYSHAEGAGNKVNGTAGHVEGNSNEIYEGAIYAHAEGLGNKIYGAGVFAHAEGDNNEVYNRTAHAEGQQNYGMGTESHVEGNHNSTYSNQCHAEGFHTVAGFNNPTDGTIGGAAHAEGSYTLAQGNSSHAEGYSTYALGNYSHASGLYTKTSVHAGFVCGKYNMANNDDIFEIGTGSGPNIAERHTALAVTNGGEIIVNKPGNDGRLPLFNLLAEGSLLLYGETTSIGSNSNDSNVSYRYKLSAVADLIGFDPDQYLTVTKTGGNIDNVYYDVYISNLSNIFSGKLVWNVVGLGNAYDRDGRFRNNLPCKANIYEFGTNGIRVGLSDDASLNRGLFAFYIYYFNSTRSVGSWSSYPWIENGSTTDPNPTGGSFFNQGTY